MLFKNRKTSACLLLSSFFILSFAQSSSLLLGAQCFNNASAISDKKCGLTRDPVFGQAILSVTITDFNNSGFSYGDSVNITFSNGKVLTDIPYYSGYNTKTGEPLLVAYPGEIYPALAYNNSVSLYDGLNLKEGNTATITLNRKGKYLETETALKLKYSNRREDFCSDEQFANFRPLSASNLKTNKFFRSASPYDNSRSRSITSNKLAKKNKIDYVINLANSSEKVEELLKNSGTKNLYCANLFQKDKRKCICLRMSQNYRSKEFAQKVVAGFKKIIISKGKCLIHCLEGKDRTGFVCMLLEALSGASVKELEKDYMETYKNYYGVTEKGTPEKYRAIKETKFDDYIDYLLSVHNKESMAKAVESYLRYGGMNDDEINELRKAICKKV